jgi:hypothetical protein
VELFGGPFCAAFCQIVRGVSEVAPASCRPRPLINRWLCFELSIRRPFAFNKLTALFRIFCQILRRVSDVAPASCHFCSSTLASHLGGNRCLPGDGTRPGKWIVSPIARDIPDLVADSSTSPWPPGSWHPQDWLTAPGHSRPFGGYCSVPEPTTLVKQESESIESTAW